MQTLSVVRVCACFDPVISPPPSWIVQPPRYPRSSTSDIACPHLIALLDLSESPPDIQARRIAEGIIECEVVKWRGRFQAFGMVCNIQPDYHTDFRPSSRISERQSWRRDGQSVWWCDQEVLAQERDCEGGGRALHYRGGRRRR